MTGAVVCATATELEAGAVVAAGVVLDTGTVLCVVLAALEAPVSDVRSIGPALGVTTLEVPSATVAAASGLLEPASAPQAARPSVSRPLSTTLQICERAAEGIIFIDHYPG